MIGLLDISLSTSALDIGNHGCEASAQMFVCGADEILQATADFDTNCEDWVYIPCTVVRVLVDVCSPDMRQATIFEEGDSDCPLNNQQ